MSVKNCPPAVLCFAGLDPSGGAGLQADIQAINSCGGHTLPIATCLTVQNTIEAYACNAVNAKLIESQFKALVKDININACKIGVIPNTDVAICIARLIQQLPNIPIVYDPVISASAGSLFTDSQTLEIIKSQLLPHVTVITPNTKELKTLLNNSTYDINQAAELCNQGPNFVFVTGADDNTPAVNNMLISQRGIEKEFTYARLTQQYHGSGCTLSSALACFLALNISIEKACLAAQDYTYRCLKNAYCIGQGQWIPSRQATN